MGTLERFNIDASHRARKHGGRVLDTAAPRAA